MKTTATLIKEIIEKKNAGNRRFSLRTLAKKMQIPSGRLSEIFSGKRRLTDYYLEKIFVALKLSEEEVALIRNAHYKETYTDPEESSNHEATLLTREHIDQLISWKLYAIMSFLETTAYTEIAQGKSASSFHTEEIGKALSLPTAEAQALLKTMEFARFIEWNDAKKKWLTRLSNTTTGYDIPSQAIQNYHLKILDLAKEKLPKVSVANRDYSSMTMTLDPKDLVRAKKMLRDFRQKFTAKLEASPRKKVYQLSMQFFPLTSDPGDTDV